MSPALALRIDYDVTVPVSPPPEGTEERAYWDAAARSGRDEPARREHAPKTRRRRRRSPASIMSSVGTIFQSPLDSLNQAHRAQASEGLFAPAPAPDWYLDEREQLMTLRDPSGKRVMRVDPSSEEYAELVEEGWR